jgi:hypothetical protein
VWYLSRGVTDYEEIVPYADIGIRYDVVVVCEELVTNLSSSLLLDNLAIQQSPHLCRRPAFPVAPGMMWILDTLNRRPTSAQLANLFTATAKQ